VNFVGRGEVAAWTTTRWMFMDASQRGRHAPCAVARPFKAPEESRAGGLLIQGRMRAAEVLLSERHSGVCLLHRAAGPPRYELLFGNGWGSGPCGAVGFRKVVVWNSLHGIRRRTRLDLTDRNHYDHAISGNLGMRDRRGDLEG
jgi:hypothetical protein